MKTTPERSALNKAKFLQELVAIIMLIVFGAALSGCQQKEDEESIFWNHLDTLKEYQITKSNRGHYLSTTQYFSRDDQWIVYDTRNKGSHIGRTCCIEVVNIFTGKKRLIYKTKDQTLYGPGVGSATFSPEKNRVLFIHGLRNSNKQRPYDFSRRTGVAVDMESPEEPIFMDARDIVPPFTEGALRGGTHAHTWSGDGEWISFTYNDNILAKLEEKGNYPVNDLRVVGVMAPFGPVKVSDDSLGENNDGIKFTVVVTEVKENPEPDSDEISKAYEDGWIGTNGYVRSDGSRQKRAIAFLGDVRGKEGNKLTEVFIADIPENITVSKPGQPIEGTKVSRPVPPAGTRQRRLTYTQDRTYPGVQGPRHWMRSTPDGSLIIFLMRDDQGIVQFYGIAPTGGEIRQITDNDFPVETTFNVSPDGKFLAYGSDQHIYVTHIFSGETKRLTHNIQDSWKSLRSINWSSEGKMIAYNRQVAQGGTSYYQIFILKKRMHSK